MFRLVLVQLFRYLLLLFLQIALFNQIELFSWLNPMPYVLFILLFPLQSSMWLLLICSFFAGLGIDIFSNLGGIHASAMVMTAALRPYVLRIVVPRSGYDDEKTLNIADIELPRYFTYSAILIFIHHFWMNLLDSFSFTEIPSVFLQSIAGGFLTFIFVALHRLSQNRTQTLA